MQPDLPKAKALAQRLAGILSVMPARHHDGAGWSRSTQAIERAVADTDPKGRVNEQMLRACGITAGSTGGWHQCCRNWIARVDRLAQAGRHPATGIGE